MGGGSTYLNRMGVRIVSNIFGTLEKMLRGPGSLLQGGSVRPILYGHKTRRGDLKKCWGVMSKYNCMDLKKYVGEGRGGYAKIFYGLEKMLGGLCQNILMT